MYSIHHLVSSFRPRLQWLVCNTSLHAPWRLFGESLLTFGRCCSFRTREACPLIFYPTPFTGKLRLSTASLSRYVVFTSRSMRYRSLRGMGVEDGRGEIGKGQRFEENSKGKELTGKRNCRQKLPTAQCSFPSPYPRKTSTTILRFFPSILLFAGRCTRAERCHMLNRTSDLLLEDTLRTS